MWVLGRLGTLVEARDAAAGNSGPSGRKPGRHFKKFWCSHDAKNASARQRAEASLVPVRQRTGMGPTSIELLVEIELKSLILAQIERWRHALHMQVERQRGGNPGGERRTGE